MAELGSGFLVGPKALTVEQTLFKADRPVLLVYPGLLARYDQIHLLEKLRDACARALDAPGFVVLLPADEQRHMPVLDGKPIPVVLSSEWARIPGAWLENIHPSQGDAGIINLSGR